MWYTALYVQLMVCTNPHGHGWPRPIGGASAEVLQHIGRLSHLSKQQQCVVHSALCPVDGLHQPSRPWLAKAHWRCQRGSAPAHQLPASRWPEACHHHLAAPAVLNQDWPKTQRDSVAGTAFRPHNRAGKVYRVWHASRQHASLLAWSVPWQMRYTQSIIPRSHCGMPHSRAARTPQSTTSGVSV